MNFDYKLDGDIYNVLVVKKNNKNSYIKIKDDLTIYVTTNYLTTKGEVKTIKKCPYCQSEIDIKATRCPYCTSQLEEN